MPSQLDHIVDAIWYSKGPIVELPSAIEGLLEEEQPGMKRLARSALAEELLPRVRGALRRKMNDEFARKLTSRFEFSSRSEDRLVRVGLRTGDKIARLVAKSRTELVKGLRDMGWRAFEHLCVHLLSAYDARSVTVTRRSKEGGLDFYAWLPASSIISEKEYLWGHLVLRVVGQAKRSDTNEAMVDEFIKKMRDFAEGVGNAWKIVDEQFAQSGAALLRMYVITGVFTRGAKESALREGILTLDGEQVAELLLRSRNASQWISVHDGELWFDIPTFIRSFEETATSS